ncbi:uncharacterized protein LY79DRAFT_563583 [Colletotrichum navitas]|uniref:Uncharacterized protein n=1 Tax=Colletotrichum navitas TaxID=681940 RepID=A0AAD8PTD9_9PEZI|nr:uncharacterized protein LY79DRAFT_563583 [Colletotrichum navitas]KAK1579677.1 hypothetical protein LY79DRAFT_563583 [Colletotrichum navitas]
MKVFLVFCFMAAISAMPFDSISMGQDVDLHGSSAESLDNEILSSTLAARFDDPEAIKSLGKRWLATVKVPQDKSDQDVVKVKGILVAFRMAKVLRRDSAGRPKFVWVCTGLQLTNIAEKPRAVEVLENGVKLLSRRTLSKLDKVDIDAPAHGFGTALDVSVQQPSDEPSSSS